MAEIPETALILAAGRGIRLGELGRVIPKALVDVGGESLISRSIRYLKQSGIREIVIVTGHLAPLLDEVAHKDPEHVRCVHNPNYACRGSLESLHVGLDAISGTVLLLESDIIYEYQSLDTILSHPASNGLLVSGMTGAGDEVFVDARKVDGSETLVGLTKDKAELQSEPLGELVGITKIGTRLRQALLDQISQSPGDCETADYESGLVRASRESRIPCVFREDLIWAEVDDEQMLHRVREIVYPALLTAAKA